LPLSIQQAAYYIQETNRVGGREDDDRIYLLKVSGRAAGVAPELRIGDDAIDLVWHDSEEHIVPVYGTSYIELFTVTTFYKQLEVIFYSPPPKGRTKPDYDYVYDDYSDVDHDEKQVIEMRVPYQQIRNRTIQVTLAGIGHDQELQSVFSSTVQEIIEHARVYDGLPFETQSYIVD